MRIAAAPISWGVCEVPGWGVQLAPERVLREARSLGFAAIEAGPPGFLPEDSGAARELLDRYGVRCVAGFHATLLHDAEAKRTELAAVESRARWLAALGAEVLVLAARLREETYDARVELGPAEWSTFFDSLQRIEATTSTLGLTLTVHPHVGTAIERGQDVDRLLDGSTVALCLDTGHLFVGGVDPAELARRVGARVRHVHLKDLDAGLAAQVRSRALPYATAVARGLYRPLGAGGANIAGVLDELGALGYDGWHVLEQDVRLAEEPAESGGPVRDIAESLRFLGADA